MNMGIIAPRGGGRKKILSEKEEAKNFKSCGGDNMMVVREVSGQTILL